MFYKYINENIIKACPKNGRANGRAISNLPRYFTNNPEVAKAEGYKRLFINIEPEYDITTQYITPKYEDKGYIIEQTWVINDFEVIEEII
jgi:hypothetical protein